MTPPTKSYRLESEIFVESGIDQSSASSRFHEWLRSDSKNLAVYEEPTGTGAELLIERHGNRFQIQVVEVADRTWKVMVNKDANDDDHVVTDDGAFPGKFFQPAENIEDAAIHYFETGMRLRPDDWDDARVLDEFQH